MNIKDFAERFVDANPGLELKEANVERWLINLERFIKRSVLKLNAIEETTRLSELTMGGAYIATYNFWILAKDAFYKQQIDQYDRYMHLFREAFEDFQRKQATAADIPCDSLAERKDQMNTWRDIKTAPVLESILATDGNHVYCGCIDNKAGKDVFIGYDLQEMEMEELFLSAIKGWQPIPGTWKPEKTADEMFREMEANHETD